MIGWVGGWMCGCVGGGGWVGGWVCACVRACARARVRVCLF